MSSARTIILLLALVLLPTLLTFLSLLHSHPRQQLAAESTEGSSQTGIRAFFSFHTPSTLFPPSAIISLTDDNSTFFLARPADFGPSLEAHGLSGQLWIGSGFADDASGRIGANNGAEGELGCSDVPGWDEFSKIYLGKDSVIDPTGFHIPEREIQTNGPDHASEDGTDDHLHHPLPSSGVSKPLEPGQPAEHEDNQSGAPATHGDIQSLQESAEISGKVVLLSRGGCGFLEKVKWAQRRGATALIVGDHTRGGALVTMYARGDTSNVSIPSLFTSHTTAHLLSSLIPAQKPTAENEDSDEEESPKKGTRVKVLESETDQDDDMPNFTPTASPRPAMSSRGRHFSSTTHRSTSEQKSRKGWVRSLFAHSRTSDMLEDSTRPPSSGRLDWWNPTWSEASSKEDTTKPHAKEKSEAKHQSKDSWWPVSHSASNDDFVIGVQDWRDPDLVAAQTIRPKSISTSTTKSVSPTASTANKAGKGDSSDNPFSGGSITPGSGRYNNPSQKPNTHEETGDQKGKNQFSQPKLPDKKQAPKQKVTNHRKETQEEHEGLWVTLTPTTMSTSPFFDTLLVLVVSPLVTLTVVYALLLLRSRIRRRRWRAPKSVVDRLPIRTYQTMTSSTTTSSSRFASPDTSNPTSPLLNSSPHSATHRVRSRAATATGVSEAVSESLERATRKSHDRNASPKKYHGKQIECVVCLEEYVDGKSKVMSLPCGHEFHAECITPWLTTRRRTCPICKGDVVRSLQAGSANPPSSTSPPPTPDRSTTTDIQTQAAETRNESPTAAIPIPCNTDLEHGDDMAATLVNDQAEASSPPSGWRGLTSMSLSAFSGEAVWREAQRENRDR